MARSDLIVGLVRHGLSGDRKMFVATVKALVADESSKQRSSIADTVSQLLAEAEGRTAIDPAVAGMLSRVEGRKSIDELILPDSVREEILTLIDEHRHAQMLAEHGLSPRHRVLLTGEPGTGKTSLSSAIAHGLGLPMYVVNYHGIMSSYLGETAAKISKIFEFASRQPCVLFVDELETISSERANNHDTGEMSRVVSSVLLLIDSLPSHVVLVGATNHADMLDRAARRRFDVQIHLPMPNADDIVSWLEAWSERTGVQVDISETLPRLEHMSYAEIEDIVLAAYRRQLLYCDDDLSFDHRLREVACNRRTI